MGQHRLASLPHQSNALQSWGAPKLAVLSLEKSGSQGGALSRQAEGLGSLRRILSCTRQLSKGQTSLLFIQGCERVQGTNEMSTRHQAFCIGSLSQTLRILSSYTDGKAWPAGSSHSFIIELPSGPKAGHIWTYVSRDLVFIMAKKVQFKRHHGAAPGMLEKAPA